MCFHRDRASLEARILDHAPIQLIADEMGVNPSAVYRHLRLHARPQLAAALSERAAPAHVADMADRLVSLLDETLAVRQRAHQTGDGRLMLQAVQQDRETTSMLMQRLGIDSTELVSGIREAQSLMRACMAVLPSHPDALQEVVQILRRDEYGSEVADVLKAQVAHSRPVGTSTSNPPRELQ